MAGLEYMERLSEQQKRLKKQKKRIEAQKRRPMGYLERRAVALARMQEQAKRIEAQRKLQVERARAARQRGEAITGIDPLERKKIAKSSFWRRKWDRRLDKLDAKLKKFGGE